jgi:hypothetical protein
VFPASNIRPSWPSRQRQTRSSTTLTPGDDDATQRQPVCRRVVEERFVVDEDDCRIKNTL